MDDSRDSNHDQETSAAALKHAEINKALADRIDEMSSQLEPIFAGRQSAVPTLEPEKVNELYARWLESVYHPTGRSAELVHESAGEYHLLRQVFKAYGLDPGEDLLDRLGLKEMKKLFDEEDRRRDARGGGKGGRS